MRTEEIPFRYDAFISYRHVEPDRAWAKWLHAALETYRVPSALVRQGVRQRIGRVFRDEDELPASADLSHEIDSALEQSRFLIVVCSPRTPESRWVNAEVLKFRELGRHDHILALLVEGEPGEAFPKALCEIRTTASGEDGATVEHLEEVEPLAADVRASRRESMQYLKRMARLRMLACLLGCTFDDLRQREHERRMRRWIMLFALMGLLLLGITALAAFAFVQRNEARTQRAVAVLAQKAAENERDKALAAANAIIEKLTAGITKPIPGYTHTQIDLVRRAQAEYDRLMDQMGSREDILRSKAKACRALGDVYYLLGDGALAAKAYEENTAIMRRLFETKSQDTNRLCILISSLRDINAFHLQNLAFTNSARTCQEIVVRLGQLDRLTGKRRNLAPAFSIYTSVYEAEAERALGNISSSELIQFVSNKMSRFLGDDFMSMGARTTLVASVAVFTQLFGNVAMPWETTTLLAPTTAQAQPGADAADQQRGILSSVSNIEARIQERDFAAAARLAEENIPRTRSLVLADPSNAVWQAMLASSLVRLGKIRAEQSENKAAAISNYVEAAEIHTALIERGATDQELFREYLTALQEIVNYYWFDCDDQATAKRYNDRRKAVAERLMGRAGSGDYSVYAFGQLLASSLNMESEILGERADVTNALRQYGICVAAVQRMIDRDPSNSTYHADLAGLYDKIGDVKRNTLDLDGALLVYRQALAMREDLMRREPNTPEHAVKAASILSYISRTCAAKRDRRAEFDARVRQVDILRRLCAAHPSAQQWHKDLFGALQSRSYLEDKEAAYLLKLEMTDISRRWHDTYPDDVEWKKNLANALLTAGSSLRGFKDDESSVPLFAESGRLFTELIAVSHEPDLLLYQEQYCQDMLGQSYEKLGFFRDALRAYQTGLSAAKRCTMVTMNSATIPTAVASLSESVARLQMRCETDVTGALKTVGDGMAYAVKYGEGKDLPSLESALASLLETAVQLEDIQGDTTSTVRMLERLLDQTGRMASEDRKMAVRIKDSCLTQLSFTWASVGNMTNAVKYLDVLTAMTNTMEGADIAEHLSNVAYHAEFLRSMPTRDATIERLYQQLVRCETNATTVDGLASKLYANLYRNRAYRLAALEKLQDIATNAPVCRIMGLSLVDDMCWTAYTTSDDALDMPNALKAIRIRFRVRENFTAELSDAPMNCLGDAGLHFNAARIIEDYFDDMAAAAGDYQQALTAASNYLAQVPAGPDECDAEFLNQTAWDIVFSRHPVASNGVHIAIALAERACALTEWKWAACLDTLARGYAQVGDTPRAIDMMKKAVAAEPGSRSLQSFLDRLVASSNQPRVEVKLMREGTTVESASFTDSGRTIVAFSEGWMSRDEGVETTFTRTTNASVRIFDASTGQQITELRTAHPPVKRSVVSADGSHVITVDNKSTLQVWDTASGKETSRCSLPPTMEPSSAMAVMPGGTTFVFAANSMMGSGNVATSGPVAYVWNVAGNTAVISFAGHTNATAISAILPFGSSVVSAAVMAERKGDQQRVTLCKWDTRTGTETWRIESTVRALRNADVTPDERYQVSVDDKGALCLREFATGRIISVTQSLIPGITCLAVSPDGKRVIVGMRDLTVRVYEIESGRALASFQRHVGAVNSVAFSPDGRYGLSASDDRTVRIWRLPP